MRKREEYQVIIEGKSVFKFYSCDMVDGFVYKTGNGERYLCKGNEFIKIGEKNHDTHRNIAKI